MAKYKLPKIEEMFEAGVHIGHQARRWHPKMEKYIFTVEKKIHIINLEQTEKLLENACEFLYKTASEGGQIIFVGTKRQASATVKAEAERCGALFVTERWLGGTITNFRVIKKSIDKLLTNLKKRESGEFQVYTKKERLMIDREIDNLQRFIGGIASLRGRPDAMFVVDPRKEKTAVREAKRFKIPVIALIDTNSDPTDVDYPLPGNDDAIRSISVMVGAVSNAIEEGYKAFAKNKDKVEAVKEEEAKVVKEVESDAPSLKINTDETVVKDAEAILKAEDTLPLGTEVVINTAVGESEPVVEESKEKEKKSTATKSKK
ncbi:30S ribosomal protein S2 [candidate division WWE3 bacterium RIFOXYC1_FULL_39_7]|uniref:Small ribosomal subunit protein uS2 n=2 Tax=Katanobacteria TaxID=422282 RepID=A0A1F4X7B4_UNCKA|nr:MAG: 30S ribosomal protein S2 [candidate division WWE3 bacterium RIFOXYC1_FULL_39_7]OGC77605.1 MAG: 30S ribosomal protein S2 [candidate division WWE3 bacterium RIFOXYD1_FULL_39_9]